MKSPGAEPVTARSALDALAEGRHSNPFALLGPHPENGVRRGYYSDNGEDAVEMCVELSEKT